LQFLIKNDIIYTSKLTKERRRFVNIEKILKDFSQSKEKKVKIYETNSQWNFVIQKQVVFKNGKRYISYYIVAYNSQAVHPNSKIIEKTFETQQKAKEFIMSFQKNIERKTK